VDAAVGPTGDRQRHGFAPQDDGKRVLEDVLHGPRPRLTRPAGELGAVVFEHDLGDRV
jgi:hypothetical protein